MTNEVGAIIKANGVKKALWDIRALEGRMENTNFYHQFRNSTSAIYDIQFALVDFPEKAHSGSGPPSAGDFAAVVGGIDAEPDLGAVAVAGAPGVCRYQQAWRAASKRAY